jgi:hypothetical protein
MYELRRINIVPDLACLAYFEESDSFNVFCWAAPTVEHLGHDATFGLLQVIYGVGSVPPNHSDFQHVAAFDSTTRMKASELIVGFNHRSSTPRPPNG